MKSSYATPGPLLMSSAPIAQRDAPGSGAGARDFSQPYYVPARDKSTTLSPADTTTLLPAEFLQALPLIKGSPLTVTPSPAAAAATTLWVRRQPDPPWVNDPATVIYDDVSTNITEAPSSLPSTIDFPVARIGMRVTALKIDSAVAPAVSQDPSAWRVATASNRLLQVLDTMIGQGVPSDVFLGLPDIADAIGHFADATALSLSLEVAAANLLADVSTTGRGCGEGVHCLIGNNTVLKALMVTATAKNNASCGWRLDPRTGLVVYHYLGVPYYRCNIAPAEASQHYLFAANLGPTGLALVHAYGSAATYGLEVEEEYTNPGKAARDLIVHGAYALALWDDGALFGYKKVPLT